MNIFNELRILSWIVVGAFVVGTTLVIVGILLLGGINLLKYLQPTLIQATGLALAITALLFFLLRLVWRLKALPMGVAILFFMLGVCMVISVSVGRMYALQYPVFVQSFGPGVGPGLPLTSVGNFFKNVNKFHVIDDIARDPADVPAPITVKGAGSEAANATGTAAALLGELEAMTASGTLTMVDETAMPEPGGTVRELYLETSEVLSEIAPGVVFNYWTFNDTVPGPLFRVQEGDIVVVTIYNRPESLHHHNVDFHAATGPGGGGAVSMVNPGEKKEFRFKAMNPGLFVYHCAAPNMAVHMAHGMYGLILVEPKEGLPPVDKEFYVMQGELYTTGALGRQGLQIFDARKMMDGIPEYITFNGRAGGVTGKMTAKVGDRVRMYVGNGGVSHNSSFHVVGEIFDTVYPEASMGGALFHNVQTTNVPAGGATIVEFTVDYPGKYVLVDHALMRTDRGAWGVLEVTGEADPTIFDGDFTVHEHMGH